MDRDIIQNHLFEDNDIQILNTLAPGASDYPFYWESGWTDGTVSRWVILGNTWASCWLGVFRGIFWVSQFCSLISAWKWISPG